MAWQLILALGLAAGTIGGIVGFGSSIMLLPVLVWSFGPKEAVPIMAIAGMMANFSRVAVWWREVDWRVAAVFCATGVPAALLGARTLVALDPRAIEFCLGLFFLAMIPVRRRLLAAGWRIGLRRMAVVGAVIGFLSGVVATVGPINTPFFLAYGLVKGPFISTEALGSGVIGVAKAIVFNRFGALPWDTAVRGLIVGSTLTAGSWIAKRFVQRLDADRFRGLMDGLLAVAGVAMLAGALR